MIKPVLLLSLVVSTFTLAACSSTASGTSCVDEPVATVKSRLSGGKCTGSPRSCSSISVYTSEGQKLCAYMDGCDFSSDYKSCAGSAASCDKQDTEYKCGHQLGCSWTTVDDSSNSPSGTSNASPGALGAPAPSPCTKAADTNGPSTGGTGSTTTAPGGPAPSSPTTGTSTSSGGSTSSSGAPAPSGGSTSSSGGSTSGAPPPGGSSSGGDDAGAPPPVLPGG